MKKIIFVLLAFCMAIVMAFAAPMQIFAAEEENTVLVMKGKESRENNEVEIYVTVEENSGVCGMLLSLAYDTSVFTLTDLEYGTAFSSLSPIHTNTETDDGYGVYPFKIFYMGEENDTTIGEMMTLRFRVKDGAPDGSYIISLKYERDQDVTYLEDGQILTKNLLIDNAKLTISDNKIISIDTVNDSNDVLGGASDKFIAIWIPIAISGAVFACGCFVLAFLLVRCNRKKKWKKI